MSINNWGTVKGESQSEGLNYAKMVSGTPLVCRIVSGVRPRYQYWLTNSIGQKLPFESLSFNHENEKWIRGALTRFVKKASLNLMAKVVLSLSPPSVHMPVLSSIVLLTS